MITIQDIQTAIAEKLILHGHTVTANEVQQGFAKPTFFIDVLPVTTAAQNKYYELVAVGAEIIYHPLVEAREHILTVSDELKNMFLYQPLAVKDRFMSVNEIIFDADKSTLTAYFELEFMQETNITEPELPKMQNLQTGVRINHGASSDTDTV